MKKLIVANWKMNPTTLTDAKKIVSAYPESTKFADIIVCPPSIFLKSLIDTTTKKVSFGAQDCFLQDHGPFTGQTSPAQIRSVGARYVIIGHSEQREFGGDTNDQIGLKLEASINSGLKPLLCVGGGPEAKSKSTNIKKIVREHLLSAFRKVGQTKIKGSNISIVYEPPWALSTVSGNRSAPMKLIFDVMSYIRSELKSYKLPATSYRLLYGGSVNGNNIKEFADQSYLDGFLVGGSSLKAKEFDKIVQSVNLQATS